MWLKPQGREKEDNQQHGKRTDVSAVKEELISWEATCKARRNHHPGWSTDEMNSNLQKLFPPENSDQGLLFCLRGRSSPCKSLCSQPCSMSYWHLLLLQAFRSISTSGK